MNHTWQASLFPEYQVLPSLLQRRVEFASLRWSFARLGLLSSFKLNFSESTNSQYYFKFCLMSIQVRFWWLDAIFWLSLPRDLCAYLKIRQNLPWMTHSGQIHSHLHVKQKYIMSSSMCYPHVFFDEIPVVSWFDIPEAPTSRAMVRYWDSSVRVFADSIGFPMVLCCGRGISLSNSAILYASNKFF